MDLIGLIVLLIIGGLVFWAVRTIAAAFAIPAPVVTVVYVLLVVVFVVFLLQSLGLWNGSPTIRMR